MKTKQSIQYKQNLKELMRLTLINILNAKGVIYTYYKQQQEREICTLIDTRLFHTAENGTKESIIVDDNGIPKGIN